MVLLVRLISVKFTLTQAPIMPLVRRLCPSFLVRSCPLTGYKQRLSTWFHVNSLWGPRAICADSHIAHTTYHSSKTNNSLMDTFEVVTKMQILKSSFKLSRLGDHWIGAKLPFWREKGQLLGCSLVHSLLLEAGCQKVKRKLC